jgi:hypothetical protein
MTGVVAGMGIHFSDEPVAQGMKNFFAFRR